VFPQISELARVGLYWKTQQKPTLALLLERVYRQALALANLQSACKLIIKSAREQSLTEIPLFVGGRPFPVFY
jgi:hypothetical protein